MIYIGLFIAITLIQGSLILLDEKIFKKGKNEGTVYLLANTIIIWSLIIWIIILTEGIKP
jgi:hypothetical protein